MLNYIWGGMIVISLIIATFTGQLESLTSAAMEGASSAIETCIGLLGIMCLWTGIAKIAENSGLTNIFTKILRPVTKTIFPKLKNGSPALNAIVMNMVANILGMGNAATPLGVAAMKELSKINSKSNVASNEMCMFVVVNTASIQLIPATVISLRQLYGSQNPTEIVVATWLCSFCSVLVGVFVAKLLEKRRRPLK